MLSGFRHVWLLATLWTVAHQTSLSMEFSKQDTGVGYHALLQLLNKGFPGGTNGKDPGSVFTFHQIV